MPHRSGPHRIDRAEVAQLLRETAELADWPRLAKTLPAARRNTRGKSSAELESERRQLSTRCDRLREQGWSFRAIARHLGCHVTFLLSMLAGHKPVSDWVLGALPEAEPDSWTGT